MNGGVMASQYGSQANVQRLLKQWAVPVGIAPSGSVGNNGALTLGTAALRTFSDGIWLYFPAGAIFAGSAAGIYWCRFSNTTVGTVYNVVLDPLTSVPYRPVTDVVFATTGPGAYTGVITQQLVATVVVPGGSMGKNGKVSVQFLRSNNNSVGLKLLNLAWGGVDSPGEWGSTNNVSIGALVDIMNMGSTQQQVLSPWGFSSVEGQVARTPFTASANTDADVAIAIKLKLPAATDVVVLDYASVSVTPA